VTRGEAWKLANHGVAAWNAHDLELIMRHYEDAVESTSLVGAQLLGTAVKWKRRARASMGAFSERMRATMVRAISVRARLRESIAAPRQ